MIVGPAIQYDRYLAAAKYGGGLEKIAGYNNLQQLSWLREGIRLAAGVGRIVTPDGLGTGWLISDELVLTNNHVVAHAPVDCRIEFNYELDWNGLPTVVERFEIDQLVKTDQALDYSILSVKGRPGDTFGFVDILGARAPSLTSSATRYPVVVQHPRGGYKQVCLTDNHLVACDDTFAWYTTDTEPGSSGSPVYDQLWRPFALHHAGGPKRLDDGRLVVLNEGIILARIVEHARDVLGGSERLRSVMSDLLLSGCFDPDVRPVSLDWYMANPRLQDALKADSRGDKEVAMLLAAAAGVAAGAAAAHWADVTSKEGAPKGDVTTMTLKAGKSKSIKIRMPGDERSVIEVFDEIFQQANREEAHKVLASIGHDQPYYEVAGLAAAFLAGVAAGAAAYKAGK